MLTAVDLGPLEACAAIGLDLDSLHPQSLRSGERADPRPQLDVPRRQRLLGDELGPVHQPQPGRVGLEPRHVREQVVRRTPERRPTRTCARGTVLSAGGGLGRGTRAPAAGSTPRAGRRDRRRGRSRAATPGPARSAPPPRPASGSPRCRRSGAARLPPPCHSRSSCDVSTPATRRGCRLARLEQSRLLLAPVVERPADRHDHRVGVPAAQHVGVGRRRVGERGQPEQQVLWHHAVGRGARLGAARAFAELRHAVESTASAPRQRGSRGSPSTRSPRMLRMMFDVPPMIV